MVIRAGLPRAAARGAARRLKAASRQGPARGPDRVPPSRVTCSLGHHPACAPWAQPRTRRRWPESRSWERGRHAAPAPLPGAWPGRRRALPGLLCLLNLAGDPVYLRSHGPTFAAPTRSGRRGDPHVAQRRAESLGGEGAAGGPAVGLLTRTPAVPPDGPQAPHLEGTPRFTGWMGASGNQRVHKASGGERVSALAPTRPSPARGLTLAQEKTVGNRSLRYCGDRFLFPCMSLSW